MERESRGQYGRTSEEEGGGAQTLAKIHDSRDVGEAAPEAFCDPGSTPCRSSTPTPCRCKKEEKKQPQKKTQKKVRKQKDQSGDEKEEKEFVMKWLEDYSWLDFNEKINKMTCKLLFKAQKKRTLSQRDRVAQIFVPVPLLDMLRAGHIKRPYKLT